jgi:hypothetical protein
MGQASSRVENWRSDPQGSISSSPSSPGEFHPEALTEPCLTVSNHTARAIPRRLPPSTSISRFLLFPVNQTDRDADSPPPLLCGHYSASSLLEDYLSITLTEWSMLSKGERSGACETICNILRKNITELTEKTVRFQLLHLFNELIQSRDKRSDQSLTLLMTLIIHSDRDHGI